MEMSMEMNDAADRPITKGRLLDLIREELSECDIRPEDFNDGRDIGCTVAEGILDLGIEMGLVEKRPSGMFRLSDLQRLPIKPGSAEGGSQSALALKALADTIAREFFEMEGHFIKQDDFAARLQPHRHPLARTQKAAKRAFQLVDRRFRRPDRKPRW